MYPKFFNRYNFLLVWVVFLNFFEFTCCSQEHKEGNTKAWQQLQKMLTPFKSIQSDFKQISKNSKGHVSQKQKGVMLLKRPGLFKWIVKPPFEQILLSDGNKIYSYDLALQQVTIRSLNQNISSIPMAILNQDIDKISKFYFLRVSKNQNDVIFTLTSKKQDSLFLSLKLCMNTDQIKTITLKDSLGTETTINLYNFKKNITIPDNDFVFIPPKDADIYDETTK